MLLSNFGTRCRLHSFHFDAQPVESPLRIRPAVSCKFVHSICEGLILRCLTAKRTNTSVGAPICELANSRGHAGVRGARRAHARRLAGAIGYFRLRQETREARKEKKEIL